MNFIYYNSCTDKILLILELEQEFLRGFGREVLVHKL
jgi:hypothetical protein